MDTPAQTHPGTGRTGYPRDRQVVDHDGDSLSWSLQNTGDVLFSTRDADDGERVEVIPTREQLLDLFYWLGDHLSAGHRLDAWERELQAAAEAADPELPTITREAEDAVYGDRQGDYGHPREDFTRTAVLWTGLLQHKLADGAYVEADDIARCQIAVKLARDVHSPKRDNRVDIAGYALTLDRLETGK